MLTLNKAKPEQLDKNKNRSIKAMERYYPLYLENSKDIDLSNRIRRNSEELGYIYYQQEQPEEAVRYFRLCAEAAAAYYTHKPTPSSGPAGARSPWPFYELLCVAIAFGSADDQLAFCRVEEIIYFNQDKEENRVHHQYVADAIALLKDVISDRPVAEESLKALLEATNHPKRNKDEQRFVAPVVRGIIALLQGDKDAWDKAVQLCLDCHLSEVKSGDYRMKKNGFICMPGMALIKMGLAKGWKTDIDSLYLPLALLEENV